MNIYTDSMSKIVDVLLSYPLRHNASSASLHFSNIIQLYSPWRCGYTYHHLGLSLHKYIVL